VSVSRVLALLACVACISCASETVKPQPKQPELAANDTPQHAIQRFVGAYEQKKASEYADMFTGDFSFEFSNDSDPNLVAKYASGWFKSDEVAASTHLFQGYTPQGQPSLPAATSINIDFSVNVPEDDNGSGDPHTHKRLATRVDGEIVVPPTAPSTDPLHYLISNNFNVLYLVRGDEALELAPSQPADTLHWYIHRWVDLSYYPGKFWTWAAFRDLYR